MELYEVEVKKRNFLSKRGNIQNVDKIVWSKSVICPNQIHGFNLDILTDI